MANSVLIKTNLKGTIAESILSEINNKTSRFFYFLGRPEAWDFEYAPFAVNDCYTDELSTRSDIVYAKQLNPTDVSLVVKRIDWKANQAYDRYDDAISTGIVGVNLTSGGSGYTSQPTVVITGSGTGAVAVADWSAATGKVTGIRVTTPGSGYLNSISNPLAVGISGGGGTGATATAVIANGIGNVTKLEDCKFYVLTDDFNVYVCLDNNKAGLSTEKPYGTSPSPVTTSDGYIWKFLYTVPIALRSKFLTSTYMPVTTSLKAQFYSNGAIRNVRVDANGSGYTALTKVVVSGDGFLESDPVYVTAAQLALPGNGGGGYTTATATVAPPFGGDVATTAWQTARVYIFGQYVSYLGNVYQVDVAGTSNASPPIHTSGSVLNGASYKYVGTIAEINVTVGSGTITTVTLKQGVRGVDITNGGTGYANGPNTVTFSSGAATGVSYAQNGVIYRVDITNKALNTYTTLPTITSFGGGGTGAAGTVLGQSGAGYQVQPAVTITGTGTITTPATITTTATKSEARIFPIINGLGAVIGTTVADGGIGYSTASLTVTGTPGTGAKLSADLLFGDVTTLQSNTELTAVDGAIYCIPVVSGGYGYTTVPTVTIRGDGTGATATATIAGGVVTGVTVTNPGSGYKWASIIFSGGAGIGASARAVIPPYGGHSKNVVRGLFARSLMFQTNLSKDQINGQNLEADYRQFGLIRNPYVYGSSTFLTSSIATACWNVTATASIPGAFVQDAVINTVPLTGDVDVSVTNVTSGTVFTLNSVSGVQVGMALAGTGVVNGTTITAINGLIVTVSNAVAGVTIGTGLRINYAARYRIVYVSGNSALLQAMDNIVPIVGEVFNYSGNSFSAATVTAPSLDKYSGDLLYQDNQIPFKPVDNTSEKITISTVLKF